MIKRRPKLVKRQYSLSGKAHARLTREAARLDISASELLRRIVDAAFAGARR